MIAVVYLDVVGVVLDILKIARVGITLIDTAVLHNRNPAIRADRGALADISDDIGREV